MLACSDSDDETGQDLSAWAKPFCGAATQFDGVLVTLPFFLSDLSSFEQAREDLEQSIPLYQTATEALMRVLDQLEPPPLAVEYHEATVELRLAQLASIEAILEIWREATSFQGVELASADLRTDTEPASARMTAAQQNLPSEVHAALTAAGSCGSLVEST